MPRRKTPGPRPGPPSTRRTVRLVAYVTPPEAKRIRKRLRPGQAISDAVRDKLLDYD